MKFSVITLSIFSAGLLIYMLFTSEFQYLPIINLLMCAAFLILAYSEFKKKNDLSTAWILLIAAILVGLFTVIGLFI